MNVIQVAGHIGRDAETRVTPGGQKVTSFSIATNVRDGGQDVTVWYRISVWGDRYDRMVPYLKKGKPIFVVGELRPPRQYTDKNGQQQVSLEVTAEMVRFSPFGQKDAEGQAQGGGGFAQQSAPTAQSPQGDAGFGGGAGVSAADFGGGTMGAGGDMAITGDDLPF